MTVGELHALEALLLGHLHGDLHLLLEARVAERVVAQDAAHGLVAAGELTADHDGLGHLVDELAAHDILKHLDAEAVLQ